MTAPEWRSCKLGEFLKVKHGFAFLGKHFVKRGQYVVLTPGNFIEEGGFKEQADKAKYYAGSFPDEYLLSKGDVIVAMTEQAEGLLGSSALIPQDGVYLHNQRLGLVQITSPDQADLNFVYYLFNLKSVRQQIQASATGIKIRHTAPSRITEVTVQLPPLPVQRRIAGILSAYDDLIENCQRRIKILESMARALYREWFLHFRFPGHEGVKFVDSPLGRIPEGWTVRSLSEVVEDIVDYRGKTPAKLKGEWSNKGIPALSALNVKAGRLVNLEKSRCVDEELYFRWMKNPLRMGDILMTSEAPLGELFLLCCENRYCLSQRLFSIRANPSIIAPVILYYCMESPATQHELRSRSSGATVAGIRQSELRKVPLIVPESLIQLQAEPVLWSLAQLRDSLEKKARNLRRARDLLLPRLIAGQINLDLI